MADGFGLGWVLLFEHRQYDKAWSLTVKRRRRFGERVAVFWQMSPAATFLGPALHAGHTVSGGDDLSLLNVASPQSDPPFSTYPHGQQGQRLSLLLRSELCGP